MNASRRRLVGRISSILLGVCLLIPGALHADPAEEKLLRVISDDPAFKVRMQAVRVLTKRLESARRPPSKEAMDGLVQALARDESHLVRGLIAFSLGVFGDARARPGLEAALADSNPFVRAQAEQALAELAKRAPAPTPTPTPTPPPRPGPSNGGKVALFVSVEPMPGVDAPRSLTDRLESLLRAEPNDRASGRVALVKDRTPGYAFRGSIASRKIERTSDGKNKVSLSVRVTVLTHPDNNLRHVFSSQASATVGSSSPEAISRLELKLLEAAGKAAMKDALAEILK